MAFELFLNLSVNAQTEELSMQLRQFLSSSLAILLGFTSANAYVPHTPQLRESVLQAEIAILLNEDGTPRCRMGENPSEYFTTEEFDALRECDEDDKLYVRAGLETEEISLGMAGSPRSNGKDLKAFLVPIAWAAPSACAIVGLNRWLDVEHGDSDAKKAGRVLTVGIIGLFGLWLFPAAALSVLKLDGAELVLGPLFGAIGAGPALLVCDKVFPEKD